MDELLETGMTTHNDVDTMFLMDMARSKRAKRCLDAHRNHNTYADMKNIHKEVLTHYENVDWWERDTQFDLLRYIEHPNGPS